MQVKSLFAGLATGVLTAICSSVAGLLGSIAFFGRNPNSIWAALFGVLIGAFVFAPLTALYGLGKGSWEGYKKSENNTFSIKDAFSDAWGIATNIFTYFKDRANEAPIKDKSKSSKGSTHAVTAALKSNSSGSRRNKDKSPKDDSSSPYHGPKRKTNSISSDSSEPDSSSDSELWHPN